MIRKKETEHAEIQSKLTDDCKGLNLQIDELTSKIESLEGVINSKNVLNEQLVNLAFANVSPSYKLILGTIPEKRERKLNEKQRQK